MSEVVIEAVPQGFEQLPEGLGYTDTLQPSYRRIEGSAVSFGLVVQQQHCNMMGICHGGVLATLADITAGTGVNVARGMKAGSPTINLSLDYIAAARLGEWLQANVEQVSLKRRFGFCSGAIYNASGMVTRFNGTFYLPDHDGMFKGRPAGDGVLTELT